MDLNSSVSKLANIGPSYSSRLGKMGILSLRDLLYYFPFRYDDLSNQKLINLANEGELVTVKATLWQITKIRTRSGKVMIKATINDSSGSLDVIWFNQTYLLTVLKPNLLINFSGRVGFFGKKKTMINPSYEIVKSGVSLHTERLVPIYSESLGVRSKWLRSKIFQILQLPEISNEDILPQNLLKAQNLLPLDTALKQIHFPTNLENAKEARKRFAFEELLLLQIRNYLRKQETLKNKLSTVFNVHEALLNKLEESLPFKLTSSQKKVIEEIKNDLKKPLPMNRLLQGEVGSGKTVVSAFALAIAAANKRQSAFMAPTDILAKQHFKTLQDILGKKYKIVLHTASSKTKEANFDIIVGTHALLTEKLKFKDLALVVVDEQQRFGVKQRALLQSKGRSPHLLAMTATPIPRTLALTVYGSLEISVIDELPVGRQEVKTYLVKEEKRTSAYQFVAKKIAEGGQAFIICPLIELSETLTSVKSAKAEFDRLQKEVFPELKLSLLHGKMPAHEKESIINDFKNRKSQVLVSTPIVEVGIDIPNANIMLIEASERFGLSSLHQLRGRVGRGERESFCLIFTQSQDPAAIERLKLMEKYQDGLLLAQMDLERRGPGDLFGTLQHGRIEFDLADTANLELIESSHDAAYELLKKPLPEKLRKTIEEKFDLNEKLTSN